LILYRPEFYIIFGFFVLLWSGTGNLVTPVAEILTVTSINRNSKKRDRNGSFVPATLQRKSENGWSLKGPSLVSSPLT
jgi:hypothetical protein